MTRLLIVEDERKLGEALVEGLTRAQYTADLALDGEEALAYAQTSAYDVIVLDVMLPKLDGFEVCRRLREQEHDVLILMLTARDATPDRVAGLDAGADDYLVKPFAYEELLARVRALLRRRAPAPRAELAYADVALDLAAREARRGDRPLTLTALEFDLLRHFLAHPRQVFTRNQLLTAVWGSDLSSTSNLVDVYVGRVRRKLTEHGAPALIQTIRGAGYRLREPDA